MHVRSRKPLQDTLTATRLAQAGRRMRLRARAQRRAAPALARAPRRALPARVAREHDGLRRPLQLLARRAEATSTRRRSSRPARRRRRYLRKLTDAGVPKRFPHGLPEEYRQQIESELAVIASSSTRPTSSPSPTSSRWARAQEILCQGRGSAANSLVCYCLHVTEVDPRRATLLFGRFISVERNEPPDIDIDFEHQRREEVIQYIYGKYGRHRAALTAVVISYRPRSALRDVGRALGIDLQRIEAVSKSQHWFDGRGIAPERLRENGFDPDAPVVQALDGADGAADRLSRATSRSTRAASSSPRAAWPSWCRSRTRRCPTAASSSGTRTTSTRSACSRSTSSRIGMLSAIRRSLEHIGAKLGRDVRDAGHPRRRHADLRHDLPRRHGRRVPDREPRADEHAAAPAAALLLRPRRRGRDRAARADPGRHGPSVPEEPHAAPTTRSIAPRSSSRR